MEMYFLKSAAALAILMLFYRIFLEKENMHVFKRFYLLGAVAASFLIPLITFTTYVEPGAADSWLLYNTEGTPEASVARQNYLGYFLWTVYALGVLFFGTKFFLNLKTLLVKIRRSPKERTGETTNVLLDQEVAPHTFWNYIFVNQKRYREHGIPAEVFEHERAHARQRHSLDILLMESLQVVFWFNPLLYFVKHSIKLNHEFLADRAVLKKGTNTAAYQQTLLAFSSGAFNCSLANSINYSLIKKRFTVMKTHTTKKAIWARSLLLLPLFALLIYSCSNTEELEIEDDSQEVTSPNKENLEIIEVVEDENNIIEVVEETEREPATPAMIAEYNRLARLYQSKGITVASAEDDEVKRLLYIHRTMTPEQRETAERLPPPPPPIVTEVQDPPLPPAPPAPPSPTEAIAAWKAEGAEFYLEGKKSSAQEALDLVKRGTTLSVEVEETDGTKKVRLTRDQD